MSRWASVSNMPDECPIKINQMAQLFDERMRRIGAQQTLIIIIIYYSVI